jgi:hypothetical protein
MVRVIATSKYNTECEYAGQTHQVFKLLKTMLPAAPPACTTVKRVEMQVEVRDVCGIYQVFLWLPAHSISSEDNTLHGAEWVARTY